MCADGCVSERERERDSVCDIESLVCMVEREEDLKVMEDVKAFSNIIAAFNFIDLMLYDFLIIARGLLFSFTKPKQKVELQMGIILKFYLVLLA